MKIETIMDKLEEYLIDTTLHLVISIEDEKYELASEIRDDMDDKIFHIREIIVRNKLSKMEPNNIEEQLHKRKYLHLKDWYETLNIPEERRAVF